jgi:hypothetical protein
VASLVSLLRLTACVATGVASPLAAQFTADRAELVLVADAGPQRRASVRIGNPTTDAATIMLAIEEWDRDDAGSYRWHPAGTVAGACGAKLALPRTRLSIPAGGSISVDIALADSVTSLSRECWNVLFIERAPESARHAVLRDRIRTAVRLYAQPADAAADGEVTAVQLLPRAAGTIQDSLEVWVRNTGDRHTVAHGAVEFRRADNTLAGRVRVPVANLLPGAHQRVRMPMPVIDGGSYEVVASVEFSGAPLAAELRSTPNVAASAILPR